MSVTQTLESEGKTATGLSDSSHTSSSSAEKYRLDEFDSRPILLYKYRGRLQTSSQKDLCKWLDKGRPQTPSTSPGNAADILTFTDEKLRVTKKPIPRYCSYVDVKRHDLYMPEEKNRYSEFPNFDSSLASIKVPSLAYWSRMFFGGYDELYIVSPESSPSSSVADEDSRRASPTNTWGHNSEEDARLGAIRERERQGLQ